ncbi:MAG: hypothetical protein ACC682_10990 [Gemmatimonadota bacterium]
MDRGDRVRLDTPGTANGRRWRVWLVAAALVGLGALVTFAVFLPPPVAAGSSRLETVAIASQPSAVRVTYQSAGALSAADVVVVRGESWAWGAIDAEFSPPSRVTATLSREGPGSFDGVLQLPLSSVYAWLVVEDATGETIDAGTMPRWEFLQRGEDGAPTREALVQRVNAYLGLSRRVALETAAELTRRFPDDPFGWSRRAALDLGAMGEDERPAQSSDYRAVLARLDRLHRPLSPNAETVAALFDLADRIGAEEVRDHWRSRLLSDHVRHRVAGNQRHIDVSREVDDLQRLEALERVWATFGDRQTTSLLGYQTALSLEDPTVVRRWAARLVDELPGVLPRVIRDLSRYPVLNDYALEVSALGLASLAGSPRPLFQTVAQHERDLAHRRAQLLAATGEALLASGDHDSARTVFQLAVRDVWDPTLFEAVARFHLSVGDTASALDLLARVAIDPIGRLDDRELIALVQPAPSGWDAYLARAARALDRDVEAGLDDVVLSAKVLNREGEVFRFDAEVATSPVVLMTYWHTAVPEAAQGIQRLEPYLATLQSSGIDVVGILEDGGADTPSVPPRAEGWRTYFDFAGEVTDIIHRWPEATHFVIENGNRIRYAGSLEAAIRVALVLREDSPLVPRR